MVYGTQITIVTGANLNQLITGGPHIVTTKIYPESSALGCRRHASYDFFQVRLRLEHGSYATPKVIPKTG